MTNDVSAVSRVQRRFLDAPQPILVHTCWEVGAEVDPVVMERAVAWLAARQAMLRTTFQRGSRAWTTRVASSAQGHVEAIDACDWTREALQDHLEAATLTRFDLAARPPFFVRLYRRPGGRTVFFFLLHHAICDGWSLQTAVTELWTVYAALSRGAEPQLTPLARTYADYVEAEDAIVRGASGARQLAFWERRLAGLPRLDAPVDHPRVIPRRYSGASIASRLDPHDWQAVKAAAPALGTTPFVLLFAACFAALAEWTGGREFAIGTSSAGRWSQQVRQVIGPLVNPIAVRATLDLAQSGRRLVRDVQARLIEALANRDLPFGVLVDRLGGAAEPGHPPFFETMFIMLNVFDLDAFRRHLAAALGIDVPEVGLVHPVPNRTCRYDFEVLSYEYDGSLWCALDYDADLFDAGTMTRLAARHATMARRLAAWPDAPASPVAAEVEV